MKDTNPYQPPKTIPKQDSISKIDREKFRHRNFRLTIDEVHENRHFVIGNLRSAMIFSFVQQCVWMIFMALILDGGRMLNYAALAALVFWALTLLTVALQKGELTQEQNLAVKWGYLPVFLIVINSVHLVRVIANLI